MLIAIQISCCQKGTFQVQIGPNLDPFSKRACQIVLFTSIQWLLLHSSLLYDFKYFPRRTIRLQHMANSLCPLSGPNSVNNSPFVFLSYTKCNSMFTYLGLIRSISIWGVTMRLQAISIPTKSIHIKRFVRPLVS